MLANMRGKLFGQINLVLIGQRHLRDGGSFVLTSGIFADQPWWGVTGGSVVSGALHRFVLSAAIELKRGLRINVVSPTMVDASAELYGPLFQGMAQTPMDDLVQAYVDSVEGDRTGIVYRPYDESMGRPSDKGAR